MKNLFTFLVLQVCFTFYAIAQNAPTEKKKEAISKDDAAIEYSAPAISNTNSNSVQGNNYQSYRDNNRSIAARDKVQSMKIGYITQSLNLTSQEAQSFWPVYNEYEAEMKKLRQNMRMDMMDAKMNFNTMSDKELNDMMDNLIAQKSKEAELFRTYHERFKKILPVRKVAMLYRAENNFKKQLLDRLGN